MSAIRRKQTDIEEISEAHHSEPDQSEDDADSIHSQSSQGRGRPRVIESWTRVISLQHDDLNANHMYPLNIDLMMAANLPRDVDKDKEAGWQPIFLPKDFVRTNIGITLDNYRLDEEQLLSAAIQITKLRTNFREKAEKAAREQGMQMNHSAEQLQKAIEKISRRGATRDLPDKSFTLDLY